MDPYLEYSILPLLILLRISPFPGWASIAQKIGDQSHADWDTFFMIFIFLDYFLHLNFVLQNSIGKPKFRVNLQLNYEFSMNFARLMRTSLLAMPLIRPHSLLSGVALLHDRLRLKFHILYAVNHRPLVYLSEPIFKNV